MDRIARDAFLPLVSALIVFVACPSPHSSSAIATQTSQPDVRIADCNGPATSLPSELRAALKPRTHRIDPDDSWAALARQVPGGFAGVVNLDGKRTLLLTHPEMAAEAKRALAADPWFRHYFDVSNAQVVQARWDF